MPETESEHLGISAVFRQTGIYGKTALILGTWFGSGLSPVASGTFGTLAAAPLVALSGIFSPLSSVLILMIMTLVAIWASQVVHNLLNRVDPSEVVIDEVAGFLLTMLWVPLSWGTLLAGFLLFRLFDIWKPWPAEPAERLHGGLGIVLDDLVAGLYANLGLRFILLFASF
ncbi:MAG: phosphatidylglycerophosphatase A [Deltaproteobacteria bacterium]|jgi:phosphatidylglycerophosphatase A|nr:phosphatidylglycerophosphatase A [Deltaproteobacteria bacterium]